MADKHHSEVQPKNLLFQKTGFYLP